MRLLIALVLLAGLISAEVPHKLAEAKPKVAVKPKQEKGKAKPKVAAVVDTAYDQHREHAIASLMGGTAASLRDMRKAVVQVINAHSHFSWKSPWASPSQEEVLGTGFFVRILGKSLIVTNAHVIKEAVSVRIRFPDFGRENFAARIVAACYEKDIALLRLVPSARKALARLRQKANSERGTKEKPYTHLSFGDSDKFPQGAVAIAVGYPLGQANLKFSTGVVSGFEHVVGRLYLQITSPINPGNSGGPLVSTDGHVMGVLTAAYEKASNVGFAIPVNSLRELFRDMVRKHLPGHPKPAKKGHSLLEMESETELSEEEEGEEKEEKEQIDAMLVDPAPHQTTIHMVKRQQQQQQQQTGHTAMLSSSSSAERKDKPDSGSSVISESEGETSRPFMISSSPKPMAFIHAFPYIGIALSPTTPDLLNYLGYKHDGGVLVRKVANRGVGRDAGFKPHDLLVEFDGHKLDRFGKALMPTTSDSTERYTVFDLAERIPFGKKIKMLVWREGKPVELSAVFDNKPEHGYAVQKIVEPVRQKVSYIIVDGVVFMALTTNHVEALVEVNPSLIKYLRGENRVEPKVVVAGILPECQLPEDSVTPGEILTSVNGKIINTLSDLKTIIEDVDQTAKAGDKKLLVFTTDENSMFVYDLDKVSTRSGSASYDLGSTSISERRHKRRSDPKRATPKKFDFDRFDEKFFF